MPILRSLLYDLWLYASMLVMGVLFAPVALRRDWTIWAMRLYCRQALWMLRRLCGIEVEIRGAVPSGPALVAAKHQSFLDIIILMRTLPSPAFVMKRSLLWWPIFGLYALRIGCAPVDRRGGAAALTRMRRRLIALRRSAPDAQLVIFPQGSRIAPGAVAPYKRGVAALYAAEPELGCAPAATNAGLFWPRGARWRRPGRAVVRFLPVIQPGLPTPILMARLETAIEDAALDLARERPEI